MIKRGMKPAGGAVVLALVAGGTIWGFGFKWDDSGDELGDSCRDSLAVGEARQFFPGAELEARTQTDEWVGHEIERCFVQGRGGTDGPVLRLQIRPAAAYRVSGAAENASATPIGHGWNGSFAVRGRPEAGVLVDCASLPGKGLLVLTEATADVDELSDGQVLQVARLATESARRAADRFSCEGALGQRPTQVDRTEWQYRPVAQASGTCRGVATSQATRLRITSVSEKPAGRALTESCSLKRGTAGHFSLTAYYGPSAEQEMYLDGRYPGSVKGAYMRSHACQGALGTAYFKLVRSPKSEDGKQDGQARDDSPEARELLAAFAAASGNRHGCPLPSGAER